MGITLFTFSGLLAPLQQLAGWLTSATPRSPRPLPRAAHSPGPAGGGVRAGSTWRPAAVRSALPSRRQLRAVRVVRVMEGCQAPASAGRMVISGRMADVCAELERLAAVEAGRAC